MKKIFFFIVFFLFFAQIAFATDIFTSDSSGNSKNSFYANETVYLAPSTTNITTNRTSVRIYIMQDSTSWNNQTNLTDASGGFKGITTNDTGYINTTSIIWPPTTTAGNYDVIIDVNSNGVYDQGIDFIDSTSAIGFQIFPVPAPSLTVAAGENNTVNHTYSFLPNNTDNVMLQIKITAGIYENVKINSLSLVATGTGDDSKGISIVKFILDADNDGLYDQGEQLFAFDKYLHDDGVVQLTISNGYFLTANTTVYFLVIYTMSNNTSNNQTYNFQVASVSAVGAITGATTKINGLPIYSVTKTISTASATTTTTSTTTTQISSITNATFTTTTTNEIPSNYMWVYIAATISVTVIFLFVILYLRASRPTKYEYKPQQ